MKNDLFKKYYLRIMNYYCPFIRITISKEMIIFKRYSLSKTGENISEYSLIDFKILV